MFKMFSTRLSLLQFAAVLAASSTAFILSACAGGVGEETNSIIGAAEDDQSAPIETDSAPQVTAPNHDTVDSAIPDTTRQEYSDKQTVVDNDTINDIVNTPAFDAPIGSDFNGILYNTNGQILDISVKLPNGTQQTQTDSLGYFTLSNLPEGTYPMFVSLGNDEIAYLVQKGTYGNSLYGPVSASAISSITAASLKAPPVETVYYDGEADTDPSVGSDTSSTDPSDSTVIGGGTPTVDGGKNGNSGLSIIPAGHDGFISSIATNELPHDIDYGVVKHWSADIANASTEPDQDGIVTSLAEWNVEVQFQLKQLDTTTSYIKNIFGQFDDKASFFSVALINGECGTTAPSLAFFVGKNNEFSCNSAVISAAEIKSYAILSVTVTVQNGLLKLYKNGFLIANNYAGYSLSKSEGVPPFVFGEENFDVKLSDVRLGEKAIDSGDVLYRYYQ